MRKQKVHIQNRYNVLSIEFNKQSHYIKNDYLTNLIQNEYSYLLSYSYDTEFIQTKFNLMAIIISDNKNPYSQCANNILYYTIDNEWGITYSNHKLKLSALFGTTIPEDLPYYDWISIENNSNFRKLFFISKLVNGSIKYIFPVNNTVHSEKNLFEKIYEILQITNVNISLN